MHFNTLLLLPHLQGRPASDIVALVNNNYGGEDPMTGVLADRLFMPYVLKLKVFQDMYNDEARTKVSYCIWLSLLLSVAPDLTGCSCMKFSISVDAWQH